jgi:hypothetical protein
MTRCADCLTDFAPDEDRFVVLKQVREMPQSLSAIGQELTYPHLFDHVYVCVRCVPEYAEPVCYAAVEMRR